MVSRAVVRWTANDNPVPIIKLERIDCVWSDCAMIQFELNFFAHVAELTSSKPKTGAIRMQFELISIDLPNAL